MLYGPYSLTEIPPHFNISNLAIGVFDGVHLGHRAVIASLPKTNLATLTFEPHPLWIIAPERAPHRLTNLEQKVALMSGDLAVGTVFALRFDEALRNLNASAFVHEINRIFPCLINIAIGENWSFGKNREGNPTRLIELARAHNIHVRVIPPVHYDGSPISSTRIREAIWHRRFDEAEHLLGWSYAISGTVVEGEKRGRQLGFPTANLDGIQQLVPPAGVYGVKVHVPSKSRDYVGVVNFGYRPTFGDYAQPTAEVHLLDFQGNLYGQQLALHSFHWLRDEKKFDGVEALKVQITEDITRARSYF